MEEPKQRAHAKAVANTLRHELEELMFEVPRLSVKKLAADPVMLEQLGQKAVEAYIKFNDRLHDPR